LQEILIIGSYNASEMKSFLDDVQEKYSSISIRYLQEFVELGTAGGLYHFRDQIRRGNPEAFFVLNGDVCSDFPLKQLFEFHKSKPNSLVQ
jgi:mannose-1-phosphate guanylyltransferase